jgi:hypothetical protein
MYLFEIFDQLCKMGLVEKFEDVMWMEGSTRWDRMYAEILKRFYDAFYVG